MAIPLFAMSSAHLIHTTARDTKKLIIIIKYNEIGVKQIEYVTQSLYIVGFANFHDKNHFTSVNTRIAR